MLITKRLFDEIKKKCKQYPYWLQIGMEVGTDKEGKGEQILHATMKGKPIGDIKKAEFPEVFTMLSSAT